MKGRISPRLQERLNEKHSPPRSPDTDTVEVPREEYEALKLDQMMLAVWRQTYEPNTYGVLPKSVIDEANAEFNRFAMRNRKVECLDVYPRKP